MEEIELNVSWYSLRHFGLVFLEGRNLLLRVELLQLFHRLCLMRLGGVRLPKHHLNP